MNYKLSLLLLILCSSILVKAQQITGTVQDRATNLKLENVTVFNKTAGKQVQTNAKGEFKIAAAVNQLLIFYQPGYHPDTLFLINLKPVRRYLVFDNKMLNTVEITAEVFNPEVQYHDVYRKAESFRLDQNRPFTFYPTRYFSKEGKFARRLKRRLEQEKIERQIDARFNEKAVKALIPLRGKELDCFMVLYRPTLKALNKLDKDDLMFYLMNSYKEFKLLPPEQRILPTLQGTQALPIQIETPAKED